MRTFEHRSSTSRMLWSIGASLGFVALAIWSVVSTPTTSLSAINAWSATGPGSAVSQTISVSPAFGSDGIAFMGLAGGGLYRSGSGGAAWVRSDSGIADGNVRSVQASPAFATDETVFAATAGGVYRSTDDATSWSRVGSTIIGVNSYSLALSPGFASDSTVFAVSSSSGSPTGAGGGAFRSTDGGNNWTAINSGLSSLNVRDISLSPGFASDSTLFAATFGGGAFKSTNSGTSWTAVNTGFTTTGLYAIATSPAYASDSTVFAASFGRGVWRTTNGGTSWTQQVSGLTDLFVYDVIPSPDYASDSTVYAAALGGIFRSTDDAATWTRVSNGMARSTGQAVAISPTYASDGTVFAAIYGAGAYKSTDFGTNWSTTGVVVDSYLRSVVASPAFVGDQTLFAGTFGGGLYRSVNGGASWDAVAAIRATEVRGLALSPGYPTDDAVFVGIRGGIYGSTNDAATFYKLSPSILDSTYVNSINLSPAFGTDGKGWAGTEGRGVYRSTNSGMSWAASNTGLGTSTANLTVRDVAPAPDFASSSKLLLATDAGVFGSTDGGASWTPSGSGVTNLFVRDIAYSPGFAADGTVVAATRGGIFRSTNGGANWSASSTGLTATDVAAVAVSPGFTGDATMLAATTGGIFRSTDGGITWTSWASGLTASNMTTIGFSPGYSSDLTVFAGSWGKGVFNRTEDLSAPVTTPSTTPSSPNGGGGWFIGSPPTVTLTRDEAGSTFYQWGATTDGGWSAYTTPVNASEGENTLYFYSADLYGNTSDAVSTTIKTDLTQSSTVDVSITTDAVSGAVELLWSAATDALSGVDGYNVWDISADVLEGTTTDLEFPLTGLTEGVSESFTVRSFDVAGNESLNGDTVVASVVGSGTSKDVDFGSNIALEFASIDVGGNTAVVTSDVAPVTPEGFDLNGAYYDFVTSASFSGNVVVTLPYDPSISDDAALLLKLYHYDTTLPEPAWVDITTSVDTVNHTVSGLTSSFSWFTLGVPDNRAPIASDGAYLIDEDSGGPILLDGIDPDGDPLVYTVTSAPLHGLLIGSAPALTYLPAPDFNGTDTVSFTVTDPSGESDSATATITVAPVNDAPVAEAGPSVTVAEGGSVVLTGQGSDVDLDPLSIMWTQTAGPSVSLSVIAPTGVSFTAPQVDADTDLVMELAVSDEEATGTDVVTIHVTDIPATIFQPTHKASWWKRHPALINALLATGPIDLGDTTVSTAAEAVKVLQHKNRKDARSPLRVHLLAALLNLRNGSNPLNGNGDIRPVIDSARAFLIAHPSAVNSKSPYRVETRALIQSLRDYCRNKK